MTAPTLRTRRLAVVAVCAVAPRASASHRWGDPSEQRMAVAIDRSDGTSVSAPEGG